MDLTSGYPLWPINDGLPHVYPRLDADARCDVAIIGAGITGALIAHHLVDAGHEVLVVDKRDVGWGSTAASTALLQYEIDVTLDDLIKMRGERNAVRSYLACRRAIDTLASIAGSVSSVDARGTIGFERKKSLYLGSDRRSRKALLRELALRQSIGLRVDWLNEEDIAARFPFRRAAALLTHDAAQVDAYAFTHALLSAATRKGARVFDRTHVEKIDASDAGVTLRTADGAQVRARHLVLAAGYEAQEFLKKRVARLVSTYAVASEPMPSLAGWGEERCLIWEHARPYLYLRSTRDGRVIIGGEDEPFRHPKKRDRLLPKKTRRLVARFGELFPELRFDVAFSWTGTFGETRDGLAYIDAHPDWPRTWCALCYGGNGITFAVLAAEIIRDALKGRANEEAELFRFDR